MEGRPVVLLHGLASDSDTWERAIGPLAAHGLRVVALDLIGHGRSDKPRGAVPARRFRRVAGRVLRRRRHRRRRRCAGTRSAERSPSISAITTRSASRPGAGVGRRPRARGASRAAGRRAARCRRVLGAAMRRGCAAVPATGAAPRAAADPGQPGEPAPGRSRARRRCRARGILRRAARSDRAGGQRGSFIEMEYLADHVPTMIVWSERDGVIPVDHARAARDHLPTSRLVVFPGGGHEPHRRHAAEFADAVADFVRVLVSWMRRIASASWDDRIRCAMAGRRRWAILAVGTLSQASTCSFIYGIPMLVPALRTDERPQPVRREPDRVGADGGRPAHPDRLGRACRPARRASRHRLRCGRRRRSSRGRGAGCTGRRPGRVAVAAGAAAPRSTPRAAAWSWGGSRCTSAAWPWVRGRPRSRSASRSQRWRCLRSRTRTGRICALLFPAALCAARAAGRCSHRASTRRVRARSTGAPAADRRTVGRAPGPRPPRQFRAGGAAVRHRRPSRWSIWSGSGTGTRRPPVG